VYAAQKCAICHSIAGVGSKKFPLAGVGTKLTADQIREWIVDPTHFSVSRHIPRTGDTARLGASRHVQRLSRQPCRSAGE
jgi:hypothetical protein